MSCQLSKAAKQEILTALPMYENYFIKRYIKRLSARPFSNNYRQEAISQYVEYLQDYLLRHLEQYQLPEEIDDKFDLVSNFQRTFEKNVEPFVEMSTVRQLKKPQYHTVLFSQVSDESMEKASYEKSISGEVPKMEDEVLKEWTQDRLVRLNKAFLKHLNRIEQIVFAGMLKGSKIPDLVSIIGPTMSGKCLTYEQVRYIRNNLQYRLVCWYGYHQFLDGAVLLKGMNLYPKHNKKVFGVNRLSEVPAKDLLKAAATLKKVVAPYKPKHSLEEIEQKVRQELIRPIEGHGHDWLFASKWYQGKKHDHYVVYVNRAGWAYSHVDKHSWNLFEAEDEKGQS